MASPFSRADLRQTFRRLAHERSFTTTVLLTLAICIGANVAIFAVVDAILIRALPYPAPEELVVAINSYPGAGVDRAGASLANYYDRRSAIPGLASIAIYQSGSAVVGDVGSPERVASDRVSKEFFSTLGVPLALGRSFTETELAEATSAVAILTDGFWRERFQADPAVLGRSFQVNGQAVTVVGVLPEGFRYLASRARFFQPLGARDKERGADNRHSNNYQMIGRLAPGASVAQIRAQLDAFNLQQSKDDPWAKLVKDAGYHTDVFPLHSDYVREIRPTLLLLQGGVFCLLLIGGVNLVNLLLIRASARSKDLAVRQALGASRRHLARDVMLETTVLGLAGGAIGLGLGAIGIRLLATLGTDQLPLGSTVAFDGRVAAVALAVSVLIGLALALPTVWFSTRAQLAPGLQAETRGGTVSRDMQRLRHFFIVAQVALAFVLLAGAGLLGLSLERALSVPPGFQADHVLTGQLILPRKNYSEWRTRLAFVERLSAAMQAEPGVTAVGITTALPLTGNVDNSAITVEGVVSNAGESIRAHYVTGVTAGYFGAMGIPLREGRLLEPADEHREQRVCVVDEEFARRYWPGRSALGRRIVKGPQFVEAEAHTIVGVVGNVKQNELTERSPQGALYMPYRWYAGSQFRTVVRTPLPPATLAPRLKQVVLRLDPELPVDESKPMQALVDESLVSRRSPALLAGLFAAVALLLSAIGTYGVLAYAVGQRRREIGVRMALGAQPAQVRAQFFALGAKLLLAGLGLGVLGAWFAGQAMQRILFGVDVFHVGVLLATTGVLSAVVLLATFLPSHRASRLSPLEALRSE